MTSLDQAFIKAYQRTPDAAPVAAHYQAPPVRGDHAVGPYGEPLQAPPADPGAWQGAGPRYRLDPAHAGGEWVQAPTPSAYADLGYANPYYALPAPPPAPAAPFVPDVQEPPPPASEPAATIGAMAAPGPVARHVPLPPTAPAPAPAEGDPAARDQSAVAHSHTAGRQIVRTESAHEAPAALPLPAIFGPSTQLDDPEDQAGFAPDWEVDHFVWPEICDRLLAAEATYFQHVGERLREATTTQPHVLLIAGCRRGEGRSTLALCLARCAAQAGVKVALLDADFGNPQLAAQLGMETLCSWSAVLRGQAPLHEAAISSVADQMTLFPLADDEQLAAEPGDPRLISLVQRISAQYALVVVDIGPLAAEQRQPFAGDDGCPVNAAIVVRDLRFTTERKALATAAQLERSGIPAVGIAENFVATDDY